MTSIDIHKDNKCKIFFLMCHFPFIETQGRDIDRECYDNSRQALFLWFYKSIAFIVTTFFKIYQYVLINNDKIPNSNILHSIVLQWILSTSKLRYSNWKTKFLWKPGFGTRKKGVFKVLKKIKTKNKCKTKNALRERERERWDGY